MEDVNLFNECKEEYDDNAESEDNWNDDDLYDDEEDEDEYNDGECEEEED